MKRVALHFFYFSLSLPFELFGISGQFLSNYGDVIKYRYDWVIFHTSRRSGIINLYLTVLFDIMQIMSISVNKDLRTLLEHTKLSSDKIADKIVRNFARENAVNVWG